MLEKRRHKRFKINEDSFVFSKMLPGRIKNISMGGMAFSHVFNNDDDLTIESLSILDKEHEFFLEDVSCRSVGNTITKSSFPFSDIKTVRQNVEFFLSSSQVNELEDYIQHHNCGQT